MVAGLMVNGSNKVYDIVQGLMESTTKEKGPRHALAFPETAFYLPLANALLGSEVKTLEDAAKVLGHAKSMLKTVQPDESWNSFLQDALSSGVGAILAGEVGLALKYLHKLEPQPECPGFFSDTLLRSLGIQLVDGRISGIAVIIGKAPDAKTAVEIVRELQKRNILTLVGDNVGGVSIIDQLKEGGLQMGLESYVVPYGRDTLSIIYVLNFAIRAALTYGGIKAGNTKACVDYVRERVPAFAMLLGGADELKAAAGAGALAAGVPIITDLDLPEVNVPGVCQHDECVIVEKDHKKIAKRAIEMRGIKVKVAEVPIPVPFSAAFEGERVRRAEMYAQFGGKFSSAFEYLKMRRMNEVEDGKVEVVGPEIDSFNEGDSAPLGIFIEVAGRKMVTDFEPILERQIHKFLNYAMGIFHMGQRDMCWIRISKEAKKAGFKIRHFGDILVAKLHDEFGAIVDKVQATLYTDEKAMSKVLADAAKSYSERDARIAGMTDESVDTFYSCTLCQSFAPDHVCVVSPERLGLCGAYSWLDAKAAHEITPTGGNQPVKKGKVLDAEKGMWEGVNEFVYDKSHHHISRMAVYSLMDSPMTSCGCFECIVAIVPEANGVMVVNREYTGDTPAGMKFTTLAGSVGGGNQTPGFLGVGRLYLASKKFISAEGGLKRLVWMPKELKEALGDRLKARCKDMGMPELFDKIADETVATDAAALVEYLQKVKHPALDMPSMM
ncbi:MAG: CO dehydrogenase/CO-methylating acetyl-CoA synthase complex subunit beta [Candidatus Omnitrophica bacterium]|nr:CO dehydrogenase/CO-methylating acetyl-CoA synthase complex subunit beta [Candidatus Omnitrophota bacterium]